jgi:hypothetical protein
MSTFRPDGAGILFDAWNYKHFALTGLMIAAVLAYFEKSQDGDAFPLS